VSRYRVHVRGAVAQVIADFPGLTVTSAGPGIVALSGEFDQAGLHGLLERIRILRYELIDIIRRPAPAASDRGGQ
jgi:hypothetical protein